MTLRRQFGLLPADQAFLERYGLPWEAIVDKSQWILIHEFPTHGGYNHPKVSIGVRLETGYPQAQLNMVYVNPPLARRDSQGIGATQATQALDGKTWQRWSRHRTPANPWKPGEDSLETHVYLIEDWFSREFEKCPSKVPA
jgi:hypothetical protein